MERLPTKKEGVFLKPHMGKESVINEKIFQGIEDGRKAYCRPHTVQIDLTDRCNNNCLCCWVHSPRLNKREIFPEGEKEIPFKLLKKLIDDLHRGGTKEIILSGSGEPFMHPHILEVIELIKSKDIYLNIITNGIFLDERMSQLLIKKHLDLMTMSVWAGTPSLYQELHPGQDCMTFERIKDNLKKIAFYKKSHNLLLPHIKIYNVICNKNYLDIQAMVDFAKDVQADSVEFQIVDIIKNKTEDLALKTSDMREVLLQFENIKKRKDCFSFGNHEKTKHKEFFELGKIWVNHKEGIILDNDCVSLTCKKGYTLGEDKRIITGESSSARGVYPSIFRYEFKDERCNECEERNYCLEDDCISTQFLNILNTGVFLEKLSSKDIENGMQGTEDGLQPCYMGWYYARVLTNGDIIPCCKAAKHALGNLYKNSFATIWHSEAYQEFRDKAKNLPKTDPYFLKINCLKSCDNRGMTLFVKEEYQKFKEHENLMARAEQHESVTVLASGFIVGACFSGGAKFGKELMLSTGGSIAYIITIDENGEYELYARYASRESRPVALLIDKVPIKKSALNNITNGWTNNDLRWHKELEITLTRGKHLFEVISSGVMPHMERFIFLKKDKEPRPIDKNDSRSFLCKERDGKEIILAKDIIAGNLNVSDFSFGKNLVIDGGDKQAYACYLFYLGETGVFEFWSRYASDESRSADVAIDTKLTKKGCLAEVTGGWTGDFLKWYKEFDVELQQGDHILEIISSQCIPHIEKFAFLKKSNASDHTKEKDLQMI